MNRNEGNLIYCLFRTCGAAGSKKAENPGNHVFMVWAAGNIAMVYHCFFRNLTACGGAWFPAGSVLSVSLLWNPRRHRSRGRLLLSGGSALSAMEAGVDLIIGRFLMEQRGKSVYFGKRAAAGQSGAGSPSSFSSVSASCLAGDSVQSGQELKGSITVEASLVMSFTLLFLAVMLLGIFEIHSRVAGSFVLQEALEQWVYLDTCPESEIEETALRRLQTFYFCGDGRLWLEAGGTRCSGVIELPARTEISVKEYHPEVTMRLWAAVQDGSGREKGGSTLQERDEP